MSRHRFFVSKFTNRRAELRGDDAHHLARVLRAEPGQVYELSDGTSVWLAKIERASRGRVEFSLVEQIPGVEPKLATALLLSIVKFDRFEWALEKATELGVTAVVPLAAARSEKALVAAAPQRAARWKKILLESAQQSRRLSAPVLHPAQTPAAAFAPTSLSSLFVFSSSSAPSESSVPSALSQSFFRKIFLSESPAAAPLNAAIDAGPKSLCCILAIGPEGGWTDAEREAAFAAGFAEASLGPYIVRTETAVAAALASVNYALGG
jgi:16S rRNA (uracil1498-N3)-methyltransferase